MIAPALWPHAWFCTIDMHEQSCSSNKKDSYTKLGYEHAKVEHTLMYSGVFDPIYAHLHLYVEVCDGTVQDGIVLASFHWLFRGGRQ